MLTTASFPFQIGYHSNSLADHDIGEACAMIADAGYTALALTIGHPYIRPFDSDLLQQVNRIRKHLTRHQLAVVIETGARYNLDPRVKHTPALVDPGGHYRVQLIHRAIDVAADLGARCVSTWSGYRAPFCEPSAAREHLLTHLDATAQYADDRGVILGFEPEPGMFIETVAEALEIRDVLGAPPPMGITLDIGHVVVAESESITTVIEQAGTLLVNVHLDDMPENDHDHLEFGEGVVDLAEALHALRDAGYAEIASVELPRQAHDAARVVARSAAAIEVACMASDSRDVLERMCRQISINPTMALNALPLSELRRGRSTAPSSGDRLEFQVMRRELVASCLASDEQVLAAEVMEQLFFLGDSNEQQALLLALDLAHDRGVLTDITSAAGVLVVEHAMRVNDPRVVGAAMSRFAAAHLSQHMWRQGVMKLIFMDIPIDGDVGVLRRTDAQLLRMLTDFAEERRQANRPVPTDVTRLIETGPLTYDRETV